MSCTLLFKGSVKTKVKQLQKAKNNLKKETTVISVISCYKAIKILLTTLTKSAFKNQQQEGIFHICIHHMEAETAVSGRPISDPNILQLLDKAL